MSTEYQAILNDPLSISDSDLDAALQGVEDESEVASDEIVPAATSTEAKQDDVDTSGTSTASQDEGAKPEQDAGDPEIDPTKAVVKTRDGKHEIPYSTLQREREERIAAQARAQQLAEQIAELQRQASETPKQLEARDAPAVAEVISSEQLDALKEEAPELAALFEGLIGKIGALEGRATRAERTADELAQRETAREQTRTRSMVEDAISNNPKLVYTRSEKPEVFNSIVDYDNFLRQQPLSQQLSLDQRLARAVAMYEAANAPIDVPGFAKAVTSQVRDKAPPRPDGVPHTLSDIPGGAIPARSETDALKDLGAGDLTAKLMDMSEKDIDKLLARVAL